KINIKPSMLAKARQLVQQADEAIRKLETEKKVYEIGVLKPVKAAVEKLITELEAAKEESRIDFVAGELRRANTMLEYELSNIKIKARLIARGQALSQETNDAIKKLDPKKSSHEIEVLKAEKAAIDKMVGELKKATDKTKIRQIQIEIYD